MQPADDPDDVGRRMEADRMMPQAKPPMPLGTVAHAKLAAVPLGATIPWSPPAAPSSPSPMTPPKEITTSNDPQKPLAVAVPRAPGGALGSGAAIKHAAGPSVSDRLNAGRRNLIPSVIQSYNTPA
jgi:hypothetical protein